MQIQLFEKKKSPETQQLIEKHSRCNVLRSDILKQDIVLFC